MSKDLEAMKSGKSAIQPISILPKSQFLFHKNLPPRDFSIMTLLGVSGTPVGASGREDSNFFFSLHFFIPAASARLAA